MYNLKLENDRKRGSGGLTYMLLVNKHWIGTKAKKKNRQVYFLLLSEHSSDHTNKAHERVSTGF